ncbi:serine/threonine-protein kinase RsbW [Palleronia salina]|uniref:Serine/threonine-protein kinase RsbW n=1 Tax=Palleronia salina TaxID=313368 RepID=A0A1M6K4W7_9RHOB|nr:ATP-binding protein [Palleronia salina]SHJ53993.1 serine/threonine-protein kinase RsbW [Palleronia salina]
MPSDQGRWPVREGPIDCAYSDDGVRVVLDGSPRTVRAALAVTLGALAPLRLSRDTIQSLELVLAEVMNNIVEHAYADVPSGRIELRVDLRNGALSCQTLDDGAPLPRGLVPDPPRPEPADAPQGGFGWLLIKSLVSDLDYVRAGRRNRLRFRLPVVQAA